MSPSPSPHAPIPWRVAGVQMDVCIGEKAKNLGRILDALHTTHAGGAQLVVFPECALTGYCFEDRAEAFALAETVPGESTRSVEAVCRETGQFAIFGLLERDRDRFFNACVLVGPDGIAGAYRKVHMPGLGVDKLADRGDRPFQVHAAGPARIGMHICYDGSFPESARVMALDGADLLVLPTNWPAAAICMAEHVVNARAHENHVYYMAVNRVGEERGFRFVGRSRICHPTGTIIAEAAHEEEAVFYADLDLALPRDKHLVRVPGKHEIDRWRDRRPEMYERIVER